MRYQSHQHPGVFLVDNDHVPQRPAVSPPRMVPTWIFPPEQERFSYRRKSNGCMGVSLGLSMVVLLLFLLIFAAMGIGSYQIHRLQKDLYFLQQKIDAENNMVTPEKQTGFERPELESVNSHIRPAAYVIGQIHKDRSHKTLQWEYQSGQAFTEGGVVYQVEEGALSVNHTGLYHIVSRVEFLFSHCSSIKSYTHTVFVRRVGSDVPLTLMKGHRKDICSQRQGHSWTSASYLGAALQLHKEDRVFVNVSNPMDLSHNHYGNFFGLYKI